MPAAANYYFDANRRLVRFKPAYHDWFGKRRNRYYLRTAAEQVGALAAELGYYWLKAESNVEDWDFPNFKDRFLTLDAVRFDNNLSITNFVIHPLAGAMYYNIARINGLSIYESVTVSALSSALYEWWLEWLEKVSVNDLVFTPAGGWAPGEFFFKLETYLASAPGGGAWGNRAMMYTLGAPVYLHHQLEEPRPPLPLAADSLGFSSAFWHQFDVGYGFSAVDNDRARSGFVHDVNIDAKLYAMPGFLRPGRFGTSFSDGNFSDVETRMSFDHTGWAEVDLKFSNDFAGYYAQDLEGSSTRLSGHALLAGANTSVQYVKRWLLGRQDMWALAHVVGPDVRYWLYSHGLSVELKATAHLDAVGIRSLPYNDWRSDFGAAGTKTELQNHGYYFGVGTSGEFAARLAYGGAELGASGAIGIYDSVEGIDREQPTVTRDVHNRDQLFELGTWFGYTVPEAPVHFGLRAEQTLRRSQMPPLVSKRWDRRLATELGLRF